MSQKYCNRYESFVPSFQYWCRHYQIVISKWIPEKVLHVFLSYFRLQTNNWVFWGWTIQPRACFLESPNVSSRFSKQTGTSQRFLFHLDSKYSRKGGWRKSGSGRFRSGKTFPIQLSHIRFSSRKLRVHVQRTKPKEMWFVRCHHMSL